MENSVHGRKLRVLDVYLVRAFNKLRLSKDHARAENVLFFLFL